MKLNQLKRQLKKTVKRKIDFNQNDEKVKNTRSNDSKAVWSGDTENNNTNVTKTVEMCVHEQEQVLTMPKMKLQVGCNGPKNF